MLTWLGDAIAGVAAAFGDGVGSLLSWLLSGLIGVITRVINAAGGIFDLLDALFGFFVSIKDTVLGLLGVFFPFIPSEVLSVIGFGLFAVLLAGIVKKVSGK